MVQQYTTDWDARFKEGDTPWEESSPSRYLESLLDLHAFKGGLY